MKPKDFFGLFVFVAHKKIVFSCANKSKRMSKSIGELKSIATQVRRDILRMVHAVNSGHPGGSLGCAEFLVVLYQNLMKRNEGFDMNGIN